MPALFIPPDHFRELRHEEIFFDPSRPLEVDLGCGDGTFIEGMATQFPERDFLGVERMLGRVEKTMRKIERGQLANARIMRLETAYTVAWLLPRASVTRLHLLCPDPWPKKKHAKRRFVQQHSLELIASRLVPGGVLLIATDIAAYAQHARTQLAHHGRWTVVEGERPDWRPDDGFEAKGVRAGRTVLAVHHDVQTVEEYFDDVILMNMRIVAAGPARDVFTPDNLRKTYGGKLALLEQVGQQMRLGGGQ